MLLTREPPESVVRNHDDRDAVAPGGPAADRAVTNENIGKLCVDLKLDRAAIALASGHRDSFRLHSMLESVCMKLNTRLLCATDS